MDTSNVNLFKQAVVHQQMGKLEIAYKMYQKILNNHPRHSDTNHNLALIEITAKKFKKALRLIKIAIDVNPDFDIYWITYAKTLIADNQLELAKKTLAILKVKKIEQAKFDELFDKIVNAEKELALKLKTLLKYFKDGFNDEAEKFALLLIKEHPDNQLCWKILGEVLKLQNKISESLDPCQKAVDLKPKDPEAHNNLGNTFWALGRTKDALVSYKKAIDLKPDFSNAHNNIGVIFKDMDRLDDALMCFKKAIKLNPKNILAFNNLALILRISDKLKEAELCYKKIILIDPNNVITYNNLGSLYFESDKLDMSISNYKKAIELMPNYASAYNNLGSSLIAIGKFDDAIINFKKSLELNPQLEEAHFNLSDAFQKVGKSNDSNKHQKMFKKNDSTKHLRLMNLKKKRDLLLKSLKNKIN
jgi:protein O-GlcNAc transferase